MKNVQAWEVFEPLSDFVLVERIEKGTTEGGLVLPAGVSEDDVNMARVLKAGPGRTLNNGTVLPNPLQAGDVIYGMGRVPMRVVLGGKEYGVVSAGECIAKQVLPRA
jgi:co-chaperonin GroES (HSP10)